MTTFARAAWQREADSNTSFCKASILGTHNSAITIVNGYGNADQFWQALMNWVAGKVCGLQAWHLQDDSSAPVTLVQLLTCR